MQQRGINCWLRIRRKAGKQVAGQLGVTTDNLKSRSAEKGKIQREGRRVSASGIFSRRCSVKTIACFYRRGTRFIQRLNTEMARQERHGIRSEWNSSNA